MAWIKTDDRLPEDEQWCWIYLGGKGVLRGWYHFKHLGFYADEMFLGIDKVSHWQPYFTPAEPDGIGKFLNGFRNDV